MTLSADEQAYAGAFIRDYSGPYATQNPSARRTGWRTKYKPISDPLIEAHLNQKYWLATKASWYPAFFYLDFDHPAPGAIYSTLERLGLEAGQYQVMTSPSYRETGNCHVALRLEYRGKLPTHRLGYEALTNALGRYPEVYPQRRRKFRLPLGREQHLVGEDGRILHHLRWEEALHYIGKLDAVPVERLPHQPALPLAPLVVAEDDPRRWRSLASAAELHEQGLQAFGTRHHALRDLANYLYRCNWQPADAAAHLKGWIRHHHNGYSKEVNRGNWRGINAEIDRIVGWIWAEHRPYPDRPHNLDRAVTRDDLVWTAQVYHGDVVNQKRLIKLVSYYRPRAHHEWIYIPHQVWREDVANMRTYHAFIADLEGKGLLRSINSYRHVEGHPELSYSRKFRLHLPNKSKETIQDDGRNVTDYYEALIAAFKSRSEIAEVTGLERTTLWRHFKAQI